MLWCYALWRNNAMLYDWTILCSMMEGCYALWWNNAMFWWNGAMLYEGTMLCSRIGWCYVLWWMMLCSMMNDAMLYNGMMLCSIMGQCHALWWTMTWSKLMLQELSGWVPYSHPSQVLKFFSWGPVLDACEKFLGSPKAWQCLHLGRREALII